MHASRLTQPRLQILYRVGGDRRRPSTSSPTSPATAARSRSAIGNGAVEPAPARHLRRRARRDLALRRERWAPRPRHGQGGRQDRGLRVASAGASRDTGIWEVRSEPTHFIQSKAMCWVALDRACALAERGLIPAARGALARRGATRSARSSTREGWDDERGSYVRAPDLRELDASLLTMALLDYCARPASGCAAPSTPFERELGARAVRLPLHGRGRRRRRGGRLPHVLVLARRRARAARAGSTRRRR